MECRKHAWGGDKGEGGDSWAMDDFSWTMDDFSFIISVQQEAYNLF
jgi:hypothetical protein